MIYDTTSVGRKDNGTMWPSKTLLIISFTSILLLAIWVDSVSCNDRLIVGDNANNIHAVVVSSSRYWFNYRHAINGLSIYKVLKENGVPDSNIILMLADEIPANPRNPFKNGMYSGGVPNSGSNNKNRQHQQSQRNTNRQRSSSSTSSNTVVIPPSLYDESTEIDYRGSEVTVENFFHVLLGTSTTSSSPFPTSSSSSSSPRVLNSNSDSTLLIYLTGHGGDQFFKFQDQEELTADDLATIFDLMYIRRRYSKVLFIADTCQAFTLGDKITSPNVYVIASSLRNENAYAHHSDRHLGLAQIERYTYYLLEYYYARATAQSTVQEILIDPFQKHGRQQHSTPLMDMNLRATIGVREDLAINQKLRDIPISEFFGRKKSNNSNKDSTSRRRQQQQQQNKQQQEGKHQESLNPLSSTAEIWQNRISADNFPPPIFLHLPSIRSTILDDESSYDNQQQKTSMTTKNNETITEENIEYRGNNPWWEPSSPQFLSAVIVVLVLGMVLEMALNPNTSSGSHDDDNVRQEDTSTIIPPPPESFLSITKQEEKIKHELKKKPINDDDDDDNNNNNNNDRAIETTTEENQSKPAATTTKKKKKRRSYKCEVTWAKDNSHQNLKQEETGEK